MRIADQIKCDWERRRRGERVREKDRERKKEKWIKDVATKLLLFRILLSERIKTTKLVCRPD